MTKRSARADDTRERLLAAAVQTFAARGFHGTTTRDIAAAAGMSPAALYVHHASKEDILYRISRQGHEATLSIVQAARAGHPDPVVQLRSAVREFVVHHARRHTTARIVNYELAALEPAHLEEITTMRRAIDGEIQDLVRSGVQSGAFSCPDRRIAAAAILSLGIDLARWYRDDGAWTPEELGEHYAEVALRIVGAEPGAGS